MKEKFIRSTIIYSILVVISICCLYQIVKEKQTLPIVSADIQDYSEPQLPVANGTWNIRSIDTQVISAHWQNVSRASITEQVLLLKALGVNYIAIGTAYDHVDELKIWVEEIHNAGLNVWFRSHWLGWEGDEGLPATMTPEDYLTKTSNFIRSNPDLFKRGDSFTMAVEAENVGVGLGKRFLNWDDYRNFLLSEVSMSNKAFADIGLSKQIYTNWLSVNGWVVKNEFTKELAQKIGLITVDHYVNETTTVGDYTDGPAVVSQTSLDMDKFHDMWGVPIFVGEWGYQIYQQLPEDIQGEVIGNMFQKFKEKDYIVGVNYWVHMGHNSKIINDENGSNLTYRKGAGVIRSYFLPFDTTPISTATPTLSSEK